ncbi:MAG: hypothetical protein JXR43_08370, partial [Burkholderiaceae bacterium]|nr:hypothetical protein [Burkholderiaceae bacterium]
MAIGPRQCSALLQDKGSSVIVEGIVRGHRDGHGFVTPDDGGPDVYLPPQQMRTVL